VVGINKAIMEHRYKNMLLEMAAQCHNVYTKMGRIKGNGLRDLIYGDHSIYKACFRMDRLGTIFTA